MDKFDARAPDGSQRLHLRAGATGAGAGARKGRRYRHPHQADAREPRTAVGLKEGGRQGGDRAATAPLTIVTLVKSEKGWVLIAKDGKILGYVGSQAAQVQLTAMPDLGHDRPVWGFDRTAEMPPTTDKVGEMRENREVSKLGKTCASISGVGFVFDCRHIRAPRGKGWNTRVWDR
jgi:hypothetical protein